MTELEGYCYIDDVVTRTGLTARTLRFWEEKGLLAPPSRTDGGLRLYSEADIARIVRIRDLKEVLGLSLDVIRELLAAEDEVDRLRQQACEHPDERLPLMGKAIAILQAQVAMMDDRAARLAELKAGYEQRLERLKQRQQEFQAQ